MRIVDADAYSEKMRNYFVAKLQNHKSEIDIVDCNADLQKMLDDMPEVYNVEKVMEQLNELAEGEGTRAELYSREHYSSKVEQYNHGKVCYLSAANVVRKGGRKD